MPTPSVFEVNEETTVKYTATLKDEEGVAIPASGITALNLTLYNLSDSEHAVLNSRDNQNVLNTNNVTISEAGVLTWLMQKEDNVILNANRDSEKHRALFVFSWSGGNKQGVHEVDFEVRNVNKHPAV